MGLKKKKSSAKRKPAIDFGAALAKARQETDHIFQQASQDESNSSGKNSGGNDDSSDDKISPRSKAAAWAWYQRGGGNYSNGSPEDVRNRALVVVQRTSRFKAEALRVNGSYTAGDTIVKAQQKWDPSQSLFDSFELLSVAKELDKALEEASASSVTSRSLVSLDCSSGKSGRKSKSSGDSGGGGGGSGGKREALVMRLSRFIPAPVMCLSDDDVATTKRTFKKSKSASSSLSSGNSNIVRSSSASSKSINNINNSNSSSGNNNNNNNNVVLASSGGSGGGNKLWIGSKFSQLLSFNSAPIMERIDHDDDDDARHGDGDDELYRHTHEHFHHHLHHHHHHLRGRT